MSIVGIGENIGDKCEDENTVFDTIVVKAPESITLDGLEVRIDNIRLF